MSESKKRTFISFEIDLETRTAFSDRLKSEGKTVSAVLKQFIEDYLNSPEQSSKQDMSDVIKRLEAIEKAEVVKRLNEVERLVGELAA